MRACAASYEYLICRTVLLLMESMQTEASAAAAAARSMDGDADPDVLKNAS